MNQKKIDMVNQLIEVIIEFSQVYKEELKTSKTKSEEILKKIIVAEFIENDF
jgi:hypothetical protein